MSFRAVRHDCGHCAVQEREYYAMDRCSEIHIDEIPNGEKIAILSPPDSVIHGHWRPTEMRTQLCCQAKEAATCETALQKNGSSVRAVLQPHAVQSHRTTKAQTVPKEFKLRTDNRSRHHAMTTRSMVRQ